MVARPKAGASLQPARIIVEKGLGSNYDAGLILVPQRKRDKNNLMNNPDFNSSLAPFFLYSGKNIKMTAKLKKSHF
jgi:hypothetical protein